MFPEKPNFDILPRNHCDPLVEYERELLLAS